MASLGHNELNDWVILQKCNLLYEIGPAQSVLSFSIVYTTSDLVL